MIIRMMTYKNEMKIQGCSPNIFVTFQIK